MVFKVPSNETILYFNDIKVTYKTMTEKVIKILKIWRIFFIDGDPSLRKKNMIGNFSSFKFSFKVPTTQAAPFSKHHNG